MKNLAQILKKLSLQHYNLYYVNIYANYNIKLKDNKNIILYYKKDYGTEYSHSINP